MIKEAILFDNEMVAAFDENGEQLSEYQGRHSKVVTKIILNSTDKTVFKFAKLGCVVEVSKVQWQTNTWGIYPTLDLIEDENEKNENKKDNKGED
jgi:hypothetical protein